MAVVPQLHEAVRRGVVLRVFRELLERARHRLVEVRELEAEHVGLMLDVAGESGGERREEEADRRRDDEQPRHGGGIARLANLPLRAPARDAAIVNMLTNEEGEERHDDAERES